MENIEILVLKPGDEQVMESFLLPRIETSMFLIGNMRAVGLVDNGNPYEGAYAAALVNGEMVGVIAHFWNDNLVVQAQGQVDVLVEAVLAESGRPVRGIIGIDDQVSAVKEVLNIDDSLVRMDEVEKLYALDLSNLVVPDMLKKGMVKARRIQSRDVDVVSEWTEGFSIEALGENPTQELKRECRSRVERSLREQNTWVLSKDEKPAAISSFNTSIREAVQIGGVWTPPELRRQGYARAVVAASLLDAAAEGVSKAILFTGMDNMPAQRAYESLGFRQIGNYRLLLLDTAFTPNKKIANW